MLYPELEPEKHSTIECSNKSHMLHTSLAYKRMERERRRRMERERRRRKTAIFHSNQENALDKQNLFFKIITKIVFVAHPYINITWNTC